MAFTLHPLPRRPSMRWKGCQPRDRFFADSPDQIGDPEMNRKPRNLNYLARAIVITLATLFIFPACRHEKEKTLIQDEPKLAGKTTADFPQITADVFKPMDGGIELTQDEIMGRNAWNLWSGGNEHFWNRVSQDSYGLLDLLKMLDNRTYQRGERFKTLGLANEPGFRAATKPDPEFGLWLDEQVTPEPAGIDEKVYGKPSGVLGFRLFPNPEFNDDARKKWDGNRFATDPTCYNNNKLVRPYRVGVACGACHIAPLPTRPPADPENPAWENLASAIGNQYINEGKVFGPNVTKGGLFYEMLAAQPRGTSDTSRIATDHINNPNAINPIFLLGERERIAAFFRKLNPFRLADAPGGADLISHDDAVMARGKTVFAESCARCHSSKQPPGSTDPQSAEGIAWFRAEVMKPDFLENNFLSNEKRYPLSVIKTNAARALGTNAKAGHVWDNFSSQTYKELSPVDELDFYNPWDENAPIKFRLKDHDVGPGYYRTPSLVSLWSSAPFLHNNMLGTFTGDPSVEGRLRAFNDAAEKLLWPEKRLGKDSIWRTQNDCGLHIRKEFVPDPLRVLAEADGYINLAFIPKGTPINLIANLQPTLLEAPLLLAKAKAAFLKIHAENLSGDAAKEELRKLVPDLLKVNNAPDFIEDEGHYFGTDLPDTDKRALIEFLKTF